jgi:hypothetical protein
MVHDEQPLQYFNRLPDQVALIVELVEDQIYLLGGESAGCQWVFKGGPDVVLHC